MRARSIGRLALAVALQGTWLAARSSIAQEPTLDPAAGRAITIAVLRDGPSPGDTLPALIESELRQLLAGRGVEIAFRTDPAFDAGWRPSNADAALRSALEDPEIDYVLATGALGTQAATRVELGKPVLSSFLQRLDLFRIADLEGDRSLKENLSFVLIPNRAEGDLRALLELEDVDHVHLAVPEEYVDGLDSFESELAALEETTGVSLSVVPLAPDATESLSRFPAAAEATMLARTPRYSVAERGELVRGLAARRVTTFSIVGHDDLAVGALAARTPPTATLIARRVALNVSELLRGTRVEELPVLLTADPQLVIDGRTAAAVGYRPSLITLGYATIRNREALELEETTLSLSEALRLAQQGNPELAISGREVEISRRERQLALSPMLPQVGGQFDLTWLDAAGLEGLIPDRLVRAGVQARQMIYDDATVSGYRSAGRLYESRQQDYEVERLDVLEQAGVAFLRLTLARLLHDIELGNLRLTEENLELAKFRADVGYSGRDEVFRWEAEVAKRRSALYERLAAIDVERVTLNQLLGVDQGTRWNPEEIAVESDRLPFLEGRLTRVVTDVDALERFRELSVDIAQENAPELASLGRRIDAQEIQLGERKRRWFLPSFFAGFDWSYQIDRQPELQDVSRSIPRLELGASYPLFQGGGRSFEVSRVSEELQRLFEVERLTRDLVERRARTAFSRLESSFPTIRFSRQAAESARRNLELVQEKYSQGIVNVTDLLEAQTESFVADQNAAVAVYSFLIDLLAFQRSIAWFEYEKAAEEREALLRRIEAELQ